MPSHHTPHDQSLQLERRNNGGLPRGENGLPLNGAQSFSESSERVVAYLNAHTPLADWSVSRVVHGEQVHVHVHQEQLLSTGARINWNESFCSRMASGAAHVVRDSRADPDYSDLGASEYVGAYAGYTISDDRGEMFGVLCGVRPEPLSNDEQLDEQLLNLLSELLSTQLELARGIDRERRRIEMSEALANTDALTGLLNRRGWDAIVADAQERLESFGDAVAVAIVDLDGLKQVNDTLGHAAGDDLIVRAARTLREAGTTACHVARYGGDEFTILANGVVPSQAATFFETFDAALESAGIAASCGFAAAEPGLASLADCLSTADRMMYQRKHGAR